jgi:hypothetical protein
LPARFGLVAAGGHRAEPGPWEVQEFALTDDIRSMVIGGGGRARRMPDPPAPMPVDRAPSVAASPTDREHFHVAALDGLGDGYTVLRRPRR